MNHIDSLRDEIARITQRGVGMPAAGLAFWLAAAQLGQMYAPRTAAVLTFIATGAVFPLGWFITRRAGGDLMHKGHPLGNLGMLLNFVQLFYWPVLVAVLFVRPDLVPFTMGVLFGSHFLPYGWFYRSRGYTVLGIAGPLAAIGLQLAAPTHAMTAIPLAMAAMYALALAMLIAENRATTAASAAA
jgi:hypothetical protein